MEIGVLSQSSTLERLIKDELKPYVKQIDTEAYYAERFLRKLGDAGIFSSANKSQKDYLLDEMYVVQETAKVCMTTAFCLWCHLAALTYVRHTKNNKLKSKMLPSLEKGEILAGTGLSNPMKYFAGLEKLYLSAKPVEGGYLISGVLPSVSNLGSEHWFGFIAGVNEGEQIMCLVPCSAEGLKMKEKVDYLGINGSATYACSFHDVFVPDEWVLSENAKEYVEEIRPAFISYQIPLGLGVTQASISSIEKVCQKQNGCNQFLNKQPEELRGAEERIQQKLQAIYKGENLHFKEIARVRLETAYLTLEAVQASMLHNGSAGYLKDSAPSRRLREAYFFANLTPTVKHLEKVLNG
ncbi:putative acyl-CoA dehydrogenase [Neobacillus bataviensis LMG 21833]|uniref:Putative acyl-CoA dehydrogenase n=1 Tax=Neobacillus bataviensis LMG 21833 TaxID=1117379 RepID=K6DC87_9BACI|nr:acyl-CoA dehydrogenase family protein [Neobacillus bataviensis]EKN70142.1 putative acyl-CoA dehydrogenase [Neobacillus bataviensis LMG 21833]